MNMKRLKKILWYMTTVSGMILTLSLVIGIIAMTMLWSVSWKVAVGALLLVWSNNIGNQPR